jgi:hypothetical protein
MLHVAPVEAITKLTLTPAANGALRLAATVNGPGTLVLAGRRYRLSRPGSAARLLTLTTRQITTLRSRRPVHVRVGVVFHPLAGRRVERTTGLTLTG